MSEHQRLARALGTSSRQTTGSSGPWRDWVVTVVFFALLAGFIEASMAGVNIFLLHRFAWVSRDVAWMAPVASLVFFGVFAAGVLALGLIVRRSPPPAALIGIMAAFTAYSLVIPYEQIAWWASLLLAAGIGVQVTRAAARAPTRWATALRRGAFTLATVLTVTSVGIRIWRVVAERRAVAHLSTADSGAPNVLLIILDTVRRSSMSLYGYTRPTTPRLAQRASQGIVFDWAISAAPWTLPSHATLFTGEIAGALDLGWKHSFRSDAPTLAEILQKRGYLTAGFVANLGYTSWESGLARGFAHYDGYPVTMRLALTHSPFGRTRVMSNLFSDHTRAGLVRALRNFSMKPRRLPTIRLAPSVTDAFLAYQGTAGDRPFFAFLNYFDAHAPYLAPEPDARRFGGANARNLDRYDASIAVLDGEVGRLLDSLERRGVLDRTIVVITSDHGEQFGEHKLNGHANSLYLPLLEVPLMIRYPALVPEGRRIAVPVTMRDVASTILDLTGARPASFPGASLARFWSAEPQHGSLVVASLDKGFNVDVRQPNGRGPMKSMLDDSLHYIHNGWDRDELYAYRTDSLELHNLAADTAWRDALERRKIALDSALRAAALPHP